MPVFGPESEAKLADCHPDISAVMHSAIKMIDFTVVWGYRGKADQDEAYATGKSQKPWPESNHNQLPCRAVDIAPWPEVYGRNDKEKAAAPVNFAFLAGIVMAHAKALGIDVRWGGDWNRNLSTSDEHFKDMGHFELYKEVV